jgi:glycosyltransferase involved in cell wall biosynthesis
LSAAPTNIHVLHVIHSLVAGGAECQLRLLCREWQAEDISCSVLCVNSDGNDLPQDRPVVMRVGANRPLSWTFLRNLFHQISSSPANIVHVWLPASISIPSMFIARLLGRRVIFSYRSKMSFHRPLCYPEFIAALICADLIASNSPPEGCAAPFVWLFRRKNGVVIPNGVSFETVKFREPLSRPRQETFRFLAVGRLTPLKNLERLLESLQLLRTSAPWSLSIAGEGESRKALEAQVARAGLADRVSFLGFQADVASLMATHDLLLLPSLSEGMPNVLLEAFASGIPVLAADIPGVRDVVGSAGAVIWVSPRSAASIAAGLDAALSGRVDLTAHSLAGRELLEQYRPSRMVDAYATLYRRLAIRQLQPAKH